MESSKAFRCTFRASLLFIFLATYLASCSKPASDISTLHDLTQAFNEWKYQEVASILSHNKTALSPQEQYYLAVSYIRLTDSKNYPNAIFLLKQAADADVAEAAGELARVYEDGVVDHPDVLKALDWYHRQTAISKKQPPSFIHYFDENGRPISAEDMFKKIEALAAEGDVDAQVQLAKSYSHGINTHVDLTKALKWYEEAARQNDKHSELILGYIYCRGLGVEKSNDTANFWLKKYNASIECSESKGQST